MVTTPTQAEKPDIRIIVATMEHLDVLTDYQCRLAYDTEGKKLDQNRVRNAVETVIKNPALGCHYLAWDKNDPTRKFIGTTLVTYEISVQLGGMVHWIRGVYTDNAARGKGVYKALHEHVLMVAKDDQNVKDVRLYVVYKNKVAQAVYEKLEMKRMSDQKLIEKDLDFAIKL